LSVLALSTPAIWCRVVQSRDVSPHNFDGLAMSSSAFSVAPFHASHAMQKCRFCCNSRQINRCHCFNFYHSRSLAACGSSRLAWSKGRRPPGGVHVLSLHWVTKQKMSKSEYCACGLSSLFILRQLTAYKIHWSCSSAIFVNV